MENQYGMLTCADDDAADTALQALAYIQFALMIHKTIWPGELGLLSNAILVTLLATASQRAHTVALAVDAAHSRISPFSDVDQAVRSTGK